MSFTYATQKAVFAGRQISGNFCSYSSYLSFPNIASVMKPLTHVHRWLSPPMEFGWGGTGGRREVTLLGLGFFLVRVKISGGV